MKFIVKVDTDTFENINRLNIIGYPKPKIILISDNSVYSVDLTRFSLIKIFKY